MPVILTITAAEVGGIARLDIVGDAVAATDVAFVLTNEQAAIEQTLDPAAFTVGVPDLLRRAVAKLIAAEVLEMRHREDGAAGDLQLGTGSSEVKLSKTPNFAAALRAEAQAALHPYRRKQALLPHSGPSPSLSPSTMQPVDNDNQDSLYGPSEIERLTNAGGSAIGSDSVTLYDPDTGRW